MIKCTNTICISDSSSSLPGEVIAFSCTLPAEHEGEHKAIAEVALGTEEQELVEVTARWTNEKGAVRVVFEEETGA